MWILTSIIAASLFLMGLLTLIRNSRGQENFQFFLLNLATTLWILVNYFQGNVPQEYIKLFVNLDFSLALAMVSAAGTFTLAITGWKKKESIRTLNIIGFLTVVGFFLILTFTQSIILKVENLPGGINVIPGDFYLFYTLLIIAGIIFASAVFIRAFIKSSGAKKQQIKFISFGLILAAIMLILTNLILPRVIDSSLTLAAIPQLGYLGLVVFVGFSTYAIVKHRLMDIRLVVARSVAYAVLIAILAAFYGASVMAIEALIFPGSLGKLNIAEGIIRTVLAVIMAFSFQPLRRWITKATDKVFFKNQYNSDEFLDTLSHTIGGTIVLVELIYKTLGLIREQIKVTRGIMVILGENGGVYNTQTFGYTEAKKLESEDMAKLGKDGILVYDELEETSHYKRLLRRYDASIVIPLKTENELEGLLILGEKLSGDMYNQQDLRVFEIIAPELAVAITNAKSFEKIEKFNVTLRQEIKKATSELEKKNEQLRELDKAKDEFISMASHQLRTPLTAIKGYLSMLLEGDAGEIRVSQYDFVNEAYQGANRMVGLINDLLNVSRMETGRFFLEPVEVDLDRVIQEEVKQLQNHAKEKKLSLKYEKKGKVPSVLADETKIRQVIMNFMDNAIYYTTQGGVSVTLEADKSHVIFKVTDTGIGVPKAQQKNLFTKFYRADNARHVRPDGTGLGIYLAKRVMDDHCGELIFHSEEGKGSTFGFKFPIHSKLKTKRVSAPQPNVNSPAIGELAAGIGVNPAVLEATQEAGIEHPLADSSDKKDLEETTKELATK